MLNMFLQQEQESSRSDAMAFHRKGWSGLAPQGGTQWSCATDRDTEQGRERTAQGKRDRGTREEMEAKTEAKAPSSPSGDG